MRNRGALVACSRVNVTTESQTEFTKSTKAILIRRLPDRSFCLKTPLSLCSLW